MPNYTPVSFKDVKITGGFWKNKQDVNRSVTAQAVYDRFSDTHRFEALNCLWHEGMPDMPHLFWDSDIAKWIEGAAYIISQRSDEHLIKLCDNAIDAIAANQESSGYFNSHFLVTQKEGRFKDRGSHELYCAGHLIEAACAYYQATGKDKLLKAMCRYADYIYDTFMVYQQAAFTTDGHPEIELALVRLAKAVGNDKYLILAKYFIDKRGNNKKDSSPYAEWALSAYDQCHMPLKRQETAEGHAVRALYIYCAMADVADKFSDRDYLRACEAIFSNIYNKRMYITGGVGSACAGEAFTVDYDLPNKTAYAETCAAIALGLFCKRMQGINLDSRYADTAERVMYNGAISGISLDGKSFFYENPLEIDPRFADVNTSTVIKQHMPIMQRVEVFECSCCPPNLLRFIASIADWFYTFDRSILFIHQYAASSAEINGAQVVQRTDYPASGDIHIKVTGNVFEKAAVRIPGWCEKYSISGEYTLQNGYAYIDIPATGEIQLKLEMPVVLMEANPNLQDNAGRVAVMRGPVVYCLEAVDNGEFLRSLFVEYNSVFTAEPNDIYDVPVLKTKGFRKMGSNSLYSRAYAEFEPRVLTFIPYYAFANRGVSEMIVWVQVR